MKHKGELIPRPWPTHRDGTPVHPYELDFTTEWAADAAHLDTNIHHLNYQARVFGRFTLSTMYRDLQRWHAPLVVSEHVWLHKAYEPGIDLPPARVMMDELEDAYDAGEVFARRVKGVSGYAITPVTSEDLDSAKLTYRAVREAAR